MEKIGMIGTGPMGLALLERLNLAGVNAVCYDAHVPALEQARALGMRVVGSAAEVAAEATLIDIVVRTERIRSIAFSVRMAFCRARSRELCCCYTVRYCRRR